MQNIDFTKAGMGTVAIHAGDKKTPYGSLGTPIVPAATYQFDTVEEAIEVFTGREFGFAYSRGGNPTQMVLQERLAALEGGEAAIMCGSGMGAVASCVLTMLKAGDHAIVAPVVYGNTHTLFEEYLTRYGVEVDFVDTSDAEAVKAAIKPNTVLIYLESPGNPTLKVSDIAKIAEVAHSADHDIKLVCDNTFATPYNQNPLKLGADVVVHSVTKYLNGHGDVIAGVVIGKKEFINEVREAALLHMTGAALSANDSYQILRGLKTFELRMERHNANAMAVARYLEAHEKVETVYYPGLESFPGHETAKKQMKGFGGMVSFDVKGGKAATARMLNACKLCSVAVSLGDADTLIANAALTHDDCPEEVLLTMGIQPGFVRMSVGLENIEDIIADLEQALAQA